MTPTQRAAAERLADDLQRFDGAERESLRDEAAALLRELAAEPVQEPVAAELPAPQLLVESAQGFVEGWTRSQVRSAINLALLKRRYAAPQQPMRCPEDGGACGAGGYCRPEPQQLKPPGDEFVSRVVRSVQPNLDVRCKAWAEQIDECKHWLDAAHGITGEPT